MRSEIIAIGLALAVAWQPACGQAPGVPAAAFPQQPSAAPAAGATNFAPPSSASAWPVQPASYDAAPATAAAQPPGTALVPPSPPRLLPGRKGESRGAHSSPTESQANGRPGSLGSLVTVGASLILVVGLFLVVAWLLRKASPAGAAALPKEVFEILGRAPLASRHQVHLVRCGRKLLLLSLSQAGIETLSEIDDPAEVDRLAGLCLQAQPGSASMVFRQVFQQFNATSGRTPIEPDRPTEIRHA